MGEKAIVQISAKSKKQIKKTEKKLVEWKGKKWVKNV